MSDFENSSVVPYCWQFLWDETMNKDIPRDIPNIFSKLSEASQDTYTL